MEHLPVPSKSGAGEQTALEPIVERRMPGPAYGGYFEIDSGGAGDEFSQWLRYWHVLLRHRFTILLATVGGLVLALVVSLLQTPIYMARTTVEFQLSDQQPFEFLSGGDPWVLQTQAQLLQSGALQGRVFSRLSGNMPAREEAVVVADGDDTDAPRRRTPLLLVVRDWLGLSPDREQKDWESALVWASAGLTVTPIRDTRIVELTSESPLPEAASAYVNTLADEFIEYKQEERWQLYQSTGAWLQKAQGELKGQLEESERRLLVYAAESGIVIAGNENVSERRMLELQEALSNAQADRIGREAVFRTAGSAPGETLMTSAAMNDLEMRLAGLRQDLAQATTAFTDAHPTVVRLHAQIGELEQAQAREQRNIRERLRIDYETALARERQLQATFDNEARLLSSQDQKLIQYKMLEREVETYRALYETTLQRGKEASLASASAPVEARIVDRAGPAFLPFRPNVPRNLSMGLMGGLVLGVGFILLRDRTDASIRTPGGLSLGGAVRELGVIPSARVDPAMAMEAGWMPRRSLMAASAAATDSHGTVDGAIELATWNRKGSLVAESVRAALTSILMSGQNGQARQVILVTSPSPREGKSTVATNLAIALAEIHKRVLLVDADLRRPRLHAIFGQANTWGLTDLLQDETPCEEYEVEALARDTQVPGLFSLPSGAGGSGSSRLLYSNRMAELLDRLRGEFDAIVIDTPPVLNLADARVLSRFVDGVVLVFRAGLTQREAATAAARLFEADGTPVLGTVLNDWNPRTMGSSALGSDEYLQYYYPDAASS